MKYWDKIKDDFVELRLKTVSKALFRSSSKVNNVSDWDGLSQFDQINALGQLFAEIDENPSNCEKMENGEGYRLSFDFVALDVLVPASIPGAVSDLPVKKFNIFFLCKIGTGINFFSRHDLTYWLVFLSM